MLDWFKIKPKIVGPMGLDVSPEQPKEKKPVKIYPKLDLPLRVLPEAEGWNVGDEYEIALKVKMTGLRTNSNEDDDWGNRAEFDIVGSAILSDEEKGDDETNDE